jgi:hypothetical protein
MYEDLNKDLRKQLYSAMLAEECAARHHTPKSTVTHPKGVIVPGDPFMTGKLKDPDYVPYCGSCTLCYRMRRTEYGFTCPNCHKKTNFDLTKFNDNVDVRYEDHPHKCI